MHTAVIIPYHRRGDDQLLAWTLDGYSRQSLAPGHSVEVHVGVDGGAGQTPEVGIELPAAEHLQVQITPLPRIGAAAIRNALTARLKADLIIFSNADARPHPDMVQSHADTIAKLPPGSLVLGTAPWERPAEPTVFDALLADSPMIFFYCQLQPHQWYDFRHAWTLNLSVRHSDFVAAGGFPDQLRPVYFEDLALAFRMLGPDRKGIFYQPEARVFHRHPISVEQYLNREELLGMMSPVLARVCPEVFAILNTGQTVDQMADSFRHWVSLDQPSHRWIYQRLCDWAKLPETTLGTGGSHNFTLMTIYQMHLPLKCLAFRLGFLRGVMLADDAHWQQRVPLSLWRKIVEP